MNPRQDQNSITNLPEYLSQSGPLLELSPVATLVLDLKGTIRYVNPAFQELMAAGELPADFSNVRQFSWVLLNEEGKPVPNGTLNEDFLKHHIKHRDDVYFFTCPHCDSATHFRLTITTIPENPELLCFWVEPIGDSMEETPRPVGVWSGEESMSGFLSGLFSDLLRMSSVQDMQEHVCGKLLEYFRCNSVFLLGGVEGKLIPVTVAGKWGPDYWSPVHGAEIANNHPAQWAFSGQKLVHIRDTQSMAELDALRDWTRARNIGSMLFLPVSSTDRQFGVLCLYHEHLFAFSNDVVGRLEQMALDMAMFWTNLSEVESTEPLQEKQHATEALERLSCPLSKEFTGILERSESGWKWKFLSPSVFHLMDIAERKMDMLPNGLFSMMPRREEIERIFRQLDAGQPVEDTWAFMDAAGNQRLFRTKLVPVDSSQPATWHVFGMETTDLDFSRNSSMRSENLWRAVALLAQTLQKPDFKERLPEMMRLLGEAADVSRMYIFENHSSESGDLLTSQWMEWVAPGIPPQIDNPDLKCMSLNEFGIQRWTQELGQNNTIHGNIIDFPLPEQEILLPQGIASLAVVPIFSEGKWWGFWGMDECRNPRKWSSPEVESLRTAASLLGTALAKKRTDSSSSWLEAQLAQSQKQETIGKMAHGIAHQFNNLLSPILGYISVALLDIPSDSPLATDLRRVLEAAERAKDLTRSLLRFGTRHTYKMENVFSGDLIRQCIKGITPYCAVPPKLECDSSLDRLVVKVDADHFQQVLLALVRKILKQPDTPAEQPVLIRCQVMSIVSGSDSGKVVSIDLIERGKPLSPSDARQVFDPFTAASGSVEDLELANAWNIVAAFGGTLAWIPSPPSGNRIRIQIPLVDTTEATSVELTPSPMPVVQAQPHAILVVEDEDAVRHFVCRTLIKHGYRVLDAPDPQKAIALANSHQEGPLSLLITDVIMPHMSGKRLYHELKRNEPEMKVLYISGYTTNMLEKQGIAPEEQNFLAKPFGVSLLASKVAQILAGK